MTNKVKPIPDGYYTVTPYLICKGAASAIDFYKKAFGATEMLRIANPSDGKVDGSVTDPYGHHWHLSTHVEDIPLEELRRRSAAIFEKK